MLGINSAASASLFFLCLDSVWDILLNIQQSFKHKDTQNDFPETLKIINHCKLCVEE